MDATTAPTCDMSHECKDPVTHIGEDGYVYCAFDALRRRNWERTRKMRPWELRWIAAGKPLPDYKPGPEPKEPAPTRCSCAHNADGTTSTTMMCPTHADQDPCLTIAQVTGRRRKGTIRAGRCTNCGHVSGV